MDYYDSIADGYSELHGEEQLAKAKIISSVLHPTPEEKLLDVGCGDGGCLDLFNCKALGIDPSKELIAKYKGIHKVMEGHAEKLPFKDEQFDIVVSITAVHNFEDFEKGLREMKRVGKEKFAFSILKKSPKAEWIGHAIESLFAIVEVIDEDKDTIYICGRK